MSERLTDNPSLFRLRVRYGKRDRLKYLGHLEVIHTIERIASMYAASMGARSAGELVDLLHILVDGGIFACYYIRLLH